MVDKLLNDASYHSYRRGYEYFKEGRVKNIQRFDGTTYSAIVSGCEDYHVRIDFAHPRKSTCDCPHAEGRRVVCKHKVALAFAVSPEALKKADDIMEEQLRYQAEREQREHEQYKRIKKKVMEMSLKDLRDYVIYQMIEDETNMIQTMMTKNFLIGKRKSSINDCFLSYIQNILYLLYFSSSFVES